MTDWLPWGAVVMAGTFATLSLTLRAIGKAPQGQTPNLRTAWIALVVTIVLSVAVYSLYLLTGEAWVWYLH